MIRPDGFAVLGLRIFRGGCGSRGAHGGGTCSAGQLTAEPPAVPRVMISSRALVRAVGRPGPPARAGMLAVATVLALWSC